MFQLEVPVSRLGYYLRHVLFALGQRDVRLCSCTFPDVERTEWQTPEGGRIKNVTKEIIAVIDNDVSHLCMTVWTFDVGLRFRSCCATGWCRDFHLDLR